MVPVVLLSSVCNSTRTALYYLYKRYYCLILLCNTTNKTRAKPKQGTSTRLQLKRRGGGGERNEKNSHTDDGSHSGRNPTWDPAARSGRWVHLCPPSAALACQPRLSASPANLSHQPRLPASITNPACQLDHVAPSSGLISANTA